MEFQITPEWVASLRRDVKAWDVRVEEAWEEGETERPWGWPNMTPPLKYAGSEAELVGI